MLASGIEVHRWDTQHSEYPTRRFTGTFGSIAGPLDFVNLKKHMSFLGYLRWVSAVNRGYMGQVTDRDVEMVNLLIEDPGLSLEKLRARNPVWHTPEVKLPSPPPRA